MKSHSKTGGASTISLGKVYKQLKNCQTSQVWTIFRNSLENAKNVPFSQKKFFTRRDIFNLPHLNVFLTALNIYKTIAT